MTRFAYVLIVLGFIGGAFVASLDPLQINWQWFAMPMVGGLAGVVMLRIGQRQLAGASHLVAENMNVLKRSLDRIVDNLEQLNEIDDLPVYEARFEIDGRFRDDLMLFADARKSIVHRHGLRAYADVMSAFAAGERYINRVWSASTDGYIDEVRTYLRRAADQFVEAREKFDALR